MPWGSKNYTYGAMDLVKDGQEVIFKRDFSRPRGERHFLGTREELEELASAVLPPAGPIGEDTHEDVDDLASPHWWPCRVTARQSEEMTARGLGHLPGDSLFDHTVVKWFYISGGFQAAMKTLDEQPWRKNPRSLAGSEVAAWEHAHGCAIEVPEDWTP